MSPRSSSRVNGQQPRPSDDENEEEEALQQNLLYVAARLMSIKGKRKIAEENIKIQKTIKAQHAELLEERKKAEKVAEIKQKINSLKFLVMRPSDVNMLVTEDLSFLKTFEEKASTSLLNIFWDLRDSMFASLLSKIFRECAPPQRSFPYENGVAPPWWPRMNAQWWTKLGFPIDKGEPTYQKPHTLPKVWKLAVLVAIIEHHSPKCIWEIVRHLRPLLDKMLPKEKFILSVALGVLDRARLRETVPSQPVIREDQRRNLSIAENSSPGHSVNQREIFKKQIDFCASSRAGSSVNGPNGENSRSSRIFVGTDHSRNTNRLMLTRMSGRTTGIVLGLDAFVEQERSLNLCQPQEMAAGTSQHQYASDPLFQETNHNQADPNSAIYDYYQVADPTIAGNKSMQNWIPMSHRTLTESESIMNQGNLIFAPNQTCQFIPDASISTQVPVMATSSSADNINYNADFNALSDALFDNQYSHRGTASGNNNNNEGLHTLVNSCNGIPDQACQVSVNTAVQMNHQGRNLASSSNFSAYDEYLQTSHTLPLDNDNAACKIDNMNALQNQQSITVQEFSGFNDFCAAVDLGVIVYDQFRGQAPQNEGGFHGEVSQNKPVNNYETGNCQTDSRSIDDDMDFEALRRYFE